ncbi:hypothetical protein [Romboutsia hominis]|uniref:hypothetical protein n=1 Tax=Romboutsia hominis TaxID=1507512 RepID=UPI000B888196|nr:hypothetical protein [Romboutsia hominis]
MLLLILVGLAPLLILLGASLLVKYLLKKKFNPNKECLRELRKTYKGKKSNIIYSIILALLIIAPEFNWRFELLLFISLFMVITDNIYILNYLKTKNKDDNTRKYILLHSIGFGNTAFVLMVIYYLIFKSTGYFLFHSFLNI